MAIALIAPYESMRLTAQRIVNERGYPAKVYVGNMQEGVRAAERAIAEGAKIVISRGGTAVLIREGLGIDVIEIKVSLYDVLDFICRHTTERSRIALFGFPSVISVAQPVCAIQGREHAVFPLGSDVAVEAVMEELEAWKPDVIIGDVIAGRLCEPKGLPFQLVGSTEATMAEALEHGVLLLNNLKRHIDGLEKLAAVLDCTQEGAVLVNSAGRIEEVNRKGCELLRSTRDDLIGTPCRGIFNAPELNTALAARKAARNILASVFDQPFVLDAAPIHQQGALNAAVILFQKVKHLQEAEGKVRKKLVDKGFYAKYTFEDILYRSEVMARTVSIAKAYSATECNIMIQGETGTGKELFAQSIHNAGPLRRGPFVAINCATLPVSLLESELFGYAPGAFTGALRSGKAGLFEQAHNGTLFLDEITEMDVFLQSRLLRALQAKEIMRLGDDRVIPVTVRVIAATNLDPALAVREGRLRADLYFRLNVLDLVIPPLRERTGDAEYLFGHYLNVYAAKRGVPTPKPPRAFLRSLASVPWAGNVRELENLAEKYVTLAHMDAEDAFAPSDGRAQVRPGDSATAAGPYAPVAGVTLPMAPWGFAQGPEEALVSGPAGRRGSGEDESLDQAVRRLVRQALEREGGNITRAAKRLAVSRNTVKRWLGDEKRGVVNF